jgi:methanogenic corrinoid protein MtbC1
MSDFLARAFVDLDRDGIIDTVKERLAGGEDPLQVLTECRQGMTYVGDRFQAGDFFLAEMMLAAEIFKAAVGIMNPYLEKARPEEPLGKIVLATLKGDIHDLGKNILCTLLQAQGFEVIDIGVDVDPDVLVDTVKKVKPDFVGFSALITTAFASMKQAAEMLVEAGLRDQLKLMVGGGVTTPMVKDFVGADFHTLDAMAGVSYCMESIRKK